MNTDRTVLACVDPGAAARAVVETARGIGSLMGADVEAVHVGRHASETLQTLAARHDVPLRLLPPPTEAALLGAVAAPGVVAAVVGARDARRAPPDRTHRPGRDPTDQQTDGRGSTRRRRWAPRPFRRLLVPLEGSEESSRPVVDHLCPLIVGEVELVVLHVFTPDTVPRVLTGPGGTCNCSATSSSPATAPTPPASSGAPDPSAPKSPRPTTNTTPISSCSAGPRTARSATPTSCATS